MYDMNTYFGRFKHFVELFSVKRCLIAEETVNKHRKTLEEFKQQPENFDLTDDKVNSALWEASYAVRSCVNESKGTILPFHSRLSSFLPMNFPLNLMLVVLPATKLNIVLANTANQSYNALINYQNSSGKEDSTDFLLKAYSCALLLSVGGGLFLSSRFKASGQLSLAKECTIRLLPSCLAGFSNLICMRSDYFLKGIDVTDKEGKHVGVSKKAGIKACLEGAATRFLFPVPAIIQIYIARQCIKRGMKGGSMRVVDVLSALVCIFIALPFGLSAFNDVRPVKSSFLEPEFKNRNETLYYNKGF